MKHRFAGAIPLILLAGLPALRGETAVVSVPASVTFTVTNVNGSTDATEFDVSFASAVLTTGHKLRIGVQATSTDFAPPIAGAAIPASRVTWAVRAAGAGTGYNGTLSGSGYVMAYQSNAGATSGDVHLIFSLAAPGSQIRAGTHTIYLQWRFESVP